MKILISISPPFMASSIQERIPIELELLYKRSQTHLTNVDKRLAVTLLTDAYCDLIDRGCIRLLDDIQNMNSSKELQDAQRTIHEIKDKVRHYLNWITGFIPNDRFLPVIEHFYTMMYHMDIGCGLQPYIALNISCESMDDAKRLLTALENGDISNLDEVIELLIRVIEEVVVPLVIRPKELMRFNFIVDKTLNGVITLALVQFKRSLRKLSIKLPREVSPLLCDHFKKFLVF